MSPSRELSGRAGGVPFDGIREPVDAAELSDRVGGVPFDGIREPVDVAELSGRVGGVSRTAFEHWIK